MRLLCTKANVKPVLILAGAAFLFVVAGCGRQQTSASKPDAGKVAAVASKMTGPGGKAAGGEQPPYKPDQPTRPTFELSQQGITLNWIEKGVLRMSATAKELHGKEVFSTGWLKDFSGKMYENGKLTGTMTAPTVLVDMNTRVVTATGGVVLKLVERNAVVRSKWMKWYSKQQKIVGNGGVTINMTTGSDKQTLTGAAFVADTALKNLTVKGSTKGLDF